MVVARYVALMRLIHVRERKSGHTLTVDGEQVDAI